jgi:membrane fusion protein (multidrug efflux system)
MSDDMATTIERDTVQRPGRPSPVAPEEVAGPAKSGGNKRTIFIIMGVVLLGLVAVGIRRWIYSLSHVSTDNAQVDGHIIPILPKVGGYVLEVRTDENRQVKAGDTLVVLDDRDYRARLAQAEADLAVALAGVSNRARVGQAEAQVAPRRRRARRTRGWPPHRRRCSERTPGWPRPARRATRRPSTCPTRASPPPRKGW